MNDPLPKAEGGADISLGGAQGGVRERWKSNAKRHENGQEARWLGQIADHQELWLGRVADHQKPKEARPMKAESEEAHYR